MPSTNLQIAKAPGPSRLNEIVAAILDDLSRGQHVSQHTEALKAYGAAAVPGLLRNLDAGDAARRSVTLYALQYCWAQEATEPVAALLKGPDARARHMAAIVLAKHKGLDGLARICEPLLDDPRPEIAGFALERIEGETPDLARIRRCMEQPRLWDYVWKYLPRYHSPELAPLTLKILAGGNLAPALAAIVALIHQNERSSPVRQELARLLAHARPDARELAAEYLLWHGSPAESAALTEALQRETDVYVRAALEAAAAGIARRAADVLAARRPEACTTTEPPVERYNRALALLGAGATPADWQTAFDVYRTAEPMEPYWAYKPEPPAEEFVAARESRLALQARLFAIPAPRGRIEAPAAAAESQYRGEFHAEPAAELIPPVREYFDPERDCYGKHMEKDVEGFGGMVHIGDDVCWHRDHRTVVAIGNGLVRQVACTFSWGHVAVIEHAGPDGERFCSMYAHLSPFVCVAPGQTVKKGRKIGSIGRSFTWENGGYIAHLHFGIHTGPYWKAHRPGTLLDVRWDGKHYTGKVVASDGDNTVVEVHTPRGAYYLRRPASWLAGYVSKAAWDQHRHDWADPQEFLRQHARG
ncbi:MAG: peptidoglycan DD-metalloendopeptidase family protein [Planctomycetota bacterium]|nr:peptidoglycan DD-metalloendopeptidase family protein [Planctomycetota bacterium]